jgi:protein-L-isoaspartate O-methyltransferase
MIIPVGPPGRQELCRITYEDDHFERTTLGAVSFVPLVRGR